MNIIILWLRYYAGIGFLIGGFMMLIVERLPSAAAVCLATTIALLFPPKFTVRGQANVLAADLGFKQFFTGHMVLSGIRWFIGILYVSAALGGFLQQEIPAAYIMALMGLVFISPLDRLFFPNLQFEKNDIKGRQQSAAIFAASNLAILLHAIALGAFFDNSPQAGYLLASLAFGLLIIAAWFTPGKLIVPRPASRYFSMWPRKASPFVSNTHKPSAKTDMNELADIRKQVAQSNHAAPALSPGQLAILSDETYFKIIDYIVLLGKNLENYKDLNEHFNEEHYRNYFLTPLNTMSPHYGAKGEVFNRKGKTDILVFDTKGNNIFIAECKCWNGPAHLLNGIDQLINTYVNWRDEKAAIIIFNRTVRKFSEMIRTATETMSGHPLCIRAGEKRTDTSWSFLFRHPNDEQRSIRMELILFNFT